jgi:PAS domain S-box-containing protein
VWSHFPIFCMNLNAHNFLKHNLLRNIFIVSLAIAIALPVYSVFYVFPVFTGLLIESTKDDAVRVARHLADSFLAGTEGLKKEQAKAEMLRESKKVLKDFDLMKLKLYAPSGEVLFSTEPRDVGSVNRNEYFHKIVAKGKVHAVVVQGGTKSLENERMNQDVVETYVPVMRDGRFMGAFEIYYDITARKKSMDRLLSHSSRILFALAASLLTIILLVLFKENRQIAARTKTEQTLKESEERYRMAIEQSHDGVAIVKGETLFAVNQQYLDMFGYGSTAELLGKSMSLTIHEDDRERVMEMHHRRQKGEPVATRYEYKGIKKHGELIFIEVSASRTVYQGEPVSLLYLRDVTTRKVLEAELFRSRNLESIGTLAGGVAHDFNNLLTAVVGNIALARMQVPGDSRTFRFLNEAERIALTGKDLTQQLITFSKGGALPPKKTTDVVRLVKDTARRAVKGSKVTLRYGFSARSLRVEADEVKLRQAFNNIITNAKEAMPEGGKVTIRGDCVTVTAENPLSMPPGDYVMLSVEDHGAGISEENLPKVFDPYFTTKGMGAQKGMGLGLAIAHSIIKEHSGFAEAESRAGFGTTIRVYLPAHESQGGEADQQEAVEAGSTQKRILVMDDEVTSRVATGVILKELGYGVAYAREGSEAAELFRSAYFGGLPFAVVLLDLTVAEGMGGMEALGELRMTDPDVKAVALSSEPLSLAASDYGAYGFSGVLTKPYSVDELRQILEEITG